VHDSGSGRDNEHVGEGRCAPLQEGEPLDVAFVLEGLVLLLRVVAARKVNLKEEFVKPFFVK
jgi:hypothetical protein